MFGIQHRMRFSDLSGVCPRDTCHSIFLRLSAIKSTANLVIYIEIRKCFNRKLPRILIFSESNLFANLADGLGGDVEERGNVL